VHKTKTQKGRSIGNYDLVVYDEAQFQTEPVFDTTIPWSAQSRLTMWFISTQATKPDAAAAKILNAVWDHDPSTRVIRSLTVNATGQIVVEAVVSSTTVVEYYKEQIQKMAAQGYTAPGNAHHLSAQPTALVVLPWWQPARSLQESAIHATRLAEQHELVERYRVEQGLPPHQDPYSLSFSRHCMGADKFAIEMLSKKAGVEAAMTKVHALDPYSVHQFCDQARRRISTANPSLMWQEFLNKYGRHEDDIRQWYFGPGTLEHGRQPLIYVFYDPAQGGAGSEAILISAMYRSYVPEATRTALLQGMALNSMSGSVSRWDMVEQLHKYMDSVQTCVRNQFQYIIFGEQFAIKLQCIRAHTLQHHRRRLHARHKFKHNLGNVIAVNSMKRRRRRWNSRLFVDSRMRQQHGASHKGLPPRQCKRARKQLSRHFQYRCLRQSRKVHLLAFVVYERCQFVNGPFQLVAQTLRGQLLHFVIHLAPSAAFARIRRLLHDDIIRTPPNVRGHICRGILLKLLDHLGRQARLQ
jgi:hypothetical protein